MDEIQNWVQWATLIAVVFIGIGSFTWFVAPVIDVPTAKDIAAEIQIPDIETPVINLTSVEDGIIDIQSTLDEDDAWEDEAESLATDEWEKKDYKDLFNWMSNVDKGNLSIDEREDIDRVVVKDITFDDMNADDENAEVTQDLKVYYEDESGDDKKAYITVVTTIEEGEVEDQSFSN